ncbi:MAG: VWA domain-containing protein [Deltaproteobacteria bacterium]|jgi:hypothetical protein|nr:VWA domain-containing protein [Deltaproteobacteria bacterium]
MENNFTELVFILDQSGSMVYLTDDTINGYNTFLEKMRPDNEHQVLLTTVLFNTYYQILHDRVDLKEVRPLTNMDYQPCGGTALLDSVGKTILRIHEKRLSQEPSQAPKKVLMVINTDGLENASREFSYAQVRTMIQTRKEFGWEFIFLGANMNAVQEASRFGIDAKRAQTFHADRRGVKSVYHGLAKSINLYRCSKNFVLQDDWNCDINDDFQNRSCDMDKDV